MSAPNNTGTQKADVVAHEIEKYGGPIAPFLKSVQESLTYRFSGMGMVIMSELSDAQELIAMARPQAANQTINRARFLVEQSGVGLPGSPESALMETLGTGTPDLSQNDRETAMFGRHFGQYMAGVSKSDAFEEGGLALFMDRELQRAQEFVSLGASEQARQTLNCIKRIITDVSGPSLERQRVSNATARVPNDNTSAEQDSGARRRLRP